MHKEEEQMQQDLMEGGRLEAQRLRYVVNRAQIISSTMMSLRPQLCFSQSKHTPLTLAALEDMMRIVMLIL